MQIAQSMQLRIEVGRAVAFLAVARFLVRVVPLHVWRGSLGQLTSSSPDQARIVDYPEVTFDEAQLVVLRKGLMLGRCVERASKMLPGKSRCLPQAVALQWLMRISRIPSRIVIAFHIKDRSGEHAYHAWAEHRGEMLIGHCDRSVYQPILTLVACEDALEREVRIEGQ